MRGKAHEALYRCRARSDARGPGIGSRRAQGVVQSGSADEGPRSGLCVRQRPSWPRRSGRGVHRRAGRWRAHRGFRRVRRVAPPACRHQDRREHRPPTDPARREATSARPRPGGRDGLAVRFAPRALQAAHPCALGTAPRAGERAGRAHPERTAAVSGPPLRRAACRRCNAR